MMPRRATLTVLVAALLMSGCATRAPLPDAVAADPPVSDVAPAFASAPAVDVQGLAALREQADVAERAGDWAAAVLAHAGVVAVAPRDKGFVQAALERAASVTGFKVHEVNA